MTDRFSLRAFTNSNVLGGSRPGAAAGLLNCREAAFDRKQTVATGRDILELALSVFMLKYRFIILLASAILGLWLSDIVIPIYKVVQDNMGTPENYLVYEGHVTFFVRGVSISMFTLAAAQLTSAGTLSVLTTSLFALVLLHFYLLLTNYIGPGLEIAWRFMYALPGFFVGIYFVIGVWLSIARKNP